VDRSSTALTVNEIIDQRPLSPFQARTILLCGLVLMLDGFDAQCIGFLAPPISESLAIPLPAFGRVFAAGLTGLMIGAMTAGPIADRWGRKWTVVMSTVVFAAFSLLTARVNSFDELVLLRFFTGLGLGGAMPNVVALTSEYAPKRLQPVFVTMLFCGMPLGALVAGLASSLMIPAWGWRSVFYLGGILPLAAALVLIPALPESVRFLTARRADPRRISRILARISPELAGTPLNLTAPEANNRKGTPVRHLFTEGRASGTVLLWVPFFMNLLMIYFIVNWLPGLLRESGMPVSAGVAAVSIFSLGGIIGSLIEGRLIRALGAYRVLLAEFALCVLLAGALAMSGASYALMMSVTLLLGVSVQGAQAGLNALSASFYPTTMRSTGVGWALGVGRIGSIIGPVLGGMLLLRGWRPQEILLAGMAPAACAALAVLFSNRLPAGASAYHPEAPPVVESGCPSERAM
jgi:AAHS family 4-hydroxybenzoate transporter-like MFS transporter